MSLVIPDVRLKNLDAIDPQETSHGKAHPCRDHLYSSIRVSVIDQEGNLQSCRKEALGNDTQGSVLLLAIQDHGAVVVSLNQEPAVVVPCDGESSHDLASTRRFFR